MVCVRRVLTYRKYLVWFRLGVAIAARDLNTDDATWRGLDQSHVVGS